MPRRGALSFIRHVLLLEKRLEAQERRLNKHLHFWGLFQEAYKRLYQTNYARTIRRRGLDAKMLAKAKMVTQRFDNISPHAAHSLGMIAGSLRRGRMLATFTRQELILLRLILSRRTVFSPRKVSLPLSWKEGKTDVS